MENKGESECSNPAKKQQTNKPRLIDLTELRFHVPLDIRTGRFGDVLPGQSLGLVLKKLNRTLQKQITQEHNGKYTKKQS